MPPKSHWLMKTEPTTYSWDDLVRDGGTHWNGVRNFQARNHMRSMRKGDKVLVYHSVDQKAVVGVAEVSREAYPDPSDEGDWSMVDIKPLKALKNAVTLSTIKAHTKLTGMALLKQSRLSVCPCTVEEFNEIVLLGR
jgi:predicted RNA-binding protein with PUA-like domain